MARFDVYRNSAGEGFLLDVQADLLSYLNTRVVVPLLPSGGVTLGRRCAMRRVRPRRRLLLPRCGWLPRILSGLAASWSGCLFGG